MTTSARAVECAQCRHALPTAARWCPLCFTPAPAPTFSGVITGRRADDPEPGERPDYVYSRWAGSSVSFGPRGRIALTIALIAVAPLIARVFPLGGGILLLMWIFVVLPWALKDVWRKVRVRR